MRKERKIISSILIISILVSVFMPIYSNAETIDTDVIFSLSSDATQLVAGQQITVTMSVDLETGKNIDTFSGFLIYDNTVLKFNTDEEFITNSQTKWNNPDYVDNNGTIQIETTRSNTNSAKSGIMYTMVFDVIKTVNSTEITLDDPINCAYLGEDIWCEGTTVQIPEVAETYTITYNSNTTDNVDNMPSIGTKVEKIDYNIATAPIRTGYVFSAWNTKADGSGTSYAAGSKYTTDADLELFAQWQIIETTLTVNPNGGVWEGSSSSQTFTQGYGTTKPINNPTTTPAGYTVRFNSNGGTTDKVSETETTTFKDWTLTGGGTLTGTIYTFADTTATLTANYEGNGIELPNATKTGSTFKGWYTAATGGTKVGDIGELYTPNANTTLFAQWEEIEYTLTINPNGGTYNGITSNSTETGVYEDTIAVTNPIAPSGYTVTLNKNDGTGTTTQVVQTMNFDQWVATGKGSLSGITYTFGDGNGTLTATYTSNNVELETPSREGYTFDGWYTLANGGTKVESPYMPINDITLYAHWTANTYEITFNPGENGTVTETTREVTYGETYGILPNPTRPGYTFAGWIDENGNPVTGNDTVNITKDTTLTATWEGETYTLTINPNGGIYNGQTTNSTIQGTYEDEKTIQNPTAPKGYTVTLDNEGSTTQIVQEKTFTGWTVVSGDGTIDGTTYTFGTQNGEIRAEYTANSVNLPTPTKEGYTFEGWYTLSREMSSSSSQIGDLAQKIHSPYMPTNDITLYAWWTANTYEITFNPGEDATVGEETRKVTYGETYGELPIPTRPGYTFAGWIDENENPVTGNNIVNITKDITLTATWEGETYTLTINPNGGIYNGQTTNSTIQGTYEDEKTIQNPTAPNGYTITLDFNYNVTPRTEQIIQTKTFDKWVIVSGNGTIDGTRYTFGTQNGEIRAEYVDNAIVLENAARIGYTFDGWYTEVTGGTKVDSTYMPESDITLYAHWIANRYQITFNPGEEGTVNPTTKEVTFAEIYGDLPMPTRPGYDFNGWYDANENKIEETNVVTILSDTTLTAKWLGAEYTVTFNPDGGQLDTTSKPVRNEGTYGELPLPTRPGYTFTGWFDPDGNKIESTTTVDLEGDTTLTAGWEENTYIITFDPGEGNVNEPTKEVKYGDTYGELPIPTRPGYTFTGWYGPDGNKIEEDDVIDILEDTTITAGWVGEEHTLNFNYDGGTGSVQSKPIQNGQAYGELPEAEKAGHTFLGWFDENNNQVTSATIANTTENITVYAKYEAKIYTVTFKNDDGTILSQTPVKYGQNAEYRGETPVKSSVAAGYKATFTGWNNTNDLQNVTENRVVTATYTISPIEYTITYYNLKDTDNSANPIIYTINTPNITLVDLPNQQKYIFKGWYTSNDENAIKVTSIDTSKLGNIVLYAQWENDLLYYASEKYKVGENDIDKFENGDIYLDKIEPETTVEELIENSDTNGVITVIDANGNELNKDDLVGTGMIIKVTRYDEEITMTAVVMGDLDGNGKVTATDLSTLNQTILKTTTIEGAEFKAADLDDNEKLTATDLSTINNTILGNIILTYDKKQV